VFLRFSFRSWFIIGAFVGIGLSASTSIVGLNRWARSSLESEVDLAEIDKHLKGQSAIEWEAMSEQAFENEDQKELAETREAIAEVLSNFTHQYSSKKGELKHFQSLYDQYSSALDKQFQLIEVGQLEQAKLIDEESVDPTFDQMSAEIERLSDRYHQQARSAYLLSNVGTWVSLLLATSTIGVLSGRFRNKMMSQNKKLNETLQQLLKAQAQLVQQEKMSSLGQLVAGVAHEINNPVNFIHGNLDPLRGYIHDLLKVLQLYEAHYPNPDADIKAKVEELDMDFVKADVEKTLASMEIGTSRIREIVLSLRNFSRMDEAQYKAVDIHEGIESTLMILKHRLDATPKRPCITIVRDFNLLPLVECYAGQLNQVFMNILVNGIDALESDLKKNPHVQKLPQIKIRTETRSDSIIVSIFDNGTGISPEVKNRIFEPFFTTKEVGKGTGMGMAISYQLITETHNGKIECFSDEGVGTEFIIELPVSLLKSA
jgi:signal transduction histidine kinase